MIPARAAGTDEENLRVFRRVRDELIVSCARSSVRAAFAGEISASQEFQISVRAIFSIGSSP